MQTSKHSLQTMCPISQSSFLICNEPPSDLDDMKTILMNKSSNLVILGLFLLIKHMIVECLMPV